MARELWDLKWIEDGCNGAFPPNTNTDDTLGTAVSDYLIGVVGVIAAVAICLSPRASKSYKILSVNTYIWQAIGYALAGVLHQIFHEDEDHMENQTLWKISYITVLLSSLFLGLLTNDLLAEKFAQIQGCFMTVLNVVVVLIVGAVIVYTAIRPNLILTGAGSLVILLYSLVVLAIRCQWLGVVGILVMIAGYLVQVLLSPQCGDEAYQNCFRDCPLPAPYFNHNALFHVLYAVGLALLAIDLTRNPLNPLSTSSKSLSLIVPEEGGGAKFSAIPENPASPLPIKDATPVVKKDDARSFFACCSTGKAKG